MADKILAVAIKSVISIVQESKAEASLAALTKISENFEQSGGAYP